MADTIKIGGELESVATGNVVAAASAIKDKVKNKYQSEINNDVARHENEIHGTGGIDSRLSDVEQMEQIVIDGGDAQIATSSDFDDPDSADRAKIPTVGAILDGLNDGVYDVSKRNPTGGPNNDGKFTLEYILSNADTLIPTSRRHGGMTISFAHISDNKYVQYRLMANSFTTDVTQWQKQGAEVTVSQNTETDKTELKIGSDVALILDKKPEYNSPNLVESGGVDAALDKVSEIEKEESSSSEDNIKVEDENGNSVVTITSDGVDAKNLKSNGHTVLTDVDGEDLATKEEVEEKADKEYFSDIITKKEENIEKEDTIVLATDKNDEVVEISGGNIEEQQDEIIYTDDSGDDEYAKINEEGVHGKNLYYKEDELEKNVKDEISRLNSKSSDYRDTDAIYERDYIKTNYKKDNVPYYLNNPSEQTSYDEDNYLEQKIKDVPTGGKKFIFVTDTHWNANQKRSNYLINYVKKRLGIKKVIFGGDAINSEKTNPDAEHGAYAKYLALHELTDYGNEFFACFGNDAIWCEGNHDANFVGFRNAMNDGASFDDYNQYLIDDTEIFKRTIANVAKANFDEVALNAIDELPYSSDMKNNLKAFVKMNYYVDDVNDKIRYIIYDTGVNGVAQTVYTATTYADSVSLFYDTLVRFINSCPDDYDVVILGHMLVWEGATNNINPILSAFKVGAATVTMENWSWKSVNDVQIYRTLTDLNILKSEPNVGDLAYVKKDSSYALYECLTQGVWALSSNVLRGVYISYQDLANAIPSPNVGDFALVKTGEPYTYTKYECAIAGTWSITSDVVTRSTNIIVYGHNSPIISALLPEYTSAFYTISIPRKFNGRMFTLSGHWHVDNAFISQSDSDVSEGGQISTRSYTYNTSYIPVSSRTNDAILEILTDTDSFNLVTDGTYGSSNPKERNTVIEQCFDVVTITDDNHVICTRFGAGTDRDYVI